MENIHKWLYKKSPRYRNTVKFFQKLVLPGFGKVPMWYFLKTFSQQLANEIITVRASAVAFNFFLALIPAMIFLFTLIPYFPVENLDEHVLSLLREFMPESAFVTVRDTVQDILVKRRTGLLSLGFIFTIYFATNGIYSLMDAFNQEDARPFFKKWFIAFGLMLALTILIIVGITVFIVGEIFLSQMLENQVFSNFSNYYFFQLLHIVTVFIIIFMAISLLYFVSPAKKNRWKLFSPGSIIAATLMVLTSYGFAFYVENFSQYNKFYGSLGALIILMIWLYINSLVLIIGFEINKSIILAQQSKQLKP